MFFTVLENGESEWLNVACARGRFWWHETSGSIRFLLVHLYLVLLELLFIDNERADISRTRNRIRIYTSRNIFILHLK